MTDNVKLLLVDAKDEALASSSEVNDLLHEGWEITRTSLRILEGGIVKMLVVLQRSHLPAVQTSVL